MCYSDKRIKRDVKEFKALEIIDKIEPNNYNLIDTIANTYEFIAQEVNEV